jgi:hypothetical protein
MGDLGYVALPVQYFLYNNEEITVNLKVKNLNKE